MSVDHSYASSSSSREDLGDEQTNLNFLPKLVFVTSNHGNGSTGTNYDHAAPEITNGRYSHVCKNCNKHFDSPENLKRHLYSHASFNHDTALKIYSCGTCGFVCRSEDDLNKHLQVHDQENGLKGETSLTANGGDTVTQIIPVLFIVKQRRVNVNISRSEENKETPAVAETHEEQNETRAESPTTSENKTQIENIAPDVGSLNSGQQCDLPKPDKKSIKKRYPCLKCRKVFTNQCSLRIHARVHVSSVYVCCRCDDAPTFQTISERLKHARTVHGTKKVKPKSEQSELSSAEAKDKSCTCEVCGKLCKNKNLLRIHCLVHSSAKDHKCKECGRAFHTSGALRAHALIHSAQRPFACELCGKTFKLKRTLSVHLKRHANTRPYICEVCNRGFNTSGNLRRHTMIHTGEKPFKCDVCDKSFRQKVSLGYHMAVHADARDYVCNSCGKAFKTRPVLHKHMEVHKDSLEFLCSDCGKCFSSKHKFSKHQKTHSERCYKCTQCDKVFADKSRIVAHQLIHTDVRNYKCDECDKAFKTKYGLQTHKSTHKTKASTTRYVCNMCGKRFRAIRYVKGHVKHHHPEVLKEHLEEEYWYKVIKGEDSKPVKVELELAKDNPSDGEQLNAVQVLENLYAEIPQTLHEMEFENYVM